MREVIRRRFEAKDNRWLDRRDHRRQLEWLEARIHQCQRNPGGQESQENVSEFDAVGQADHRHWREQVVIGTFCVWLWRANLEVVCEGEGDRAEGGQIGCRLNGVSSMAGLILFYNETPHLAGCRRSGEARWTWIRVGWKTGTQTRCCPPWHKTNRRFPLDFTTRTGSYKSSLARLAAQSSREGAMPALAAAHQKKIERLDSGAPHQV